MPISYGTYATPRADLGEAVLEVPEQEFIAGMVLTKRPTPKKSGTLSVKTRENMKRVETAHSTGSTFNRTRIVGEDLEYKCQDYGIEDVLADSEREEFAEDFDAELELVEDLERKIKTEYEIRTKELVFNTTTFTGAALYTDDKATPFSTIGTDIIGLVLKYVQTVAENGGGIADTMVIGKETLFNMQKNTGIKAMFPGASLVTQAMIIDALPAILGLKRIIVGAATYDTADVGQDFTGSWIWPKTYAMICRLNEGGNLRRGGLGVTFEWSKMADPIGKVVQYREEQSEGDVFRTRQFQDEFLLDVYAGHLARIET